MDWLWIALAVGAIFFVMRAGGMGGCGMGPSSRHSHDEGADRSPPDHGSNFGPSFDPVSRHAVTANGPAVSSVYHGQAYFFENRENRDAFEGNPEKYVSGGYVSGGSSSGQVIEAERDDDHRLHRRHGC